MSQTRENHVLIVDDDLNVQEALIAVLTDYGLTTVTANNGREALEILRMHGPKPCCVLLDLHMPVMNGWDFRREQKADPTICDVPVVIFTGGEHHQSSDVPVITSTMLMKPLGVRVLVDTISAEIIRCKLGRAASIH